MASERDPLALAMFAAWVNSPPDALPEKYRGHTCDATMAAWKRVGEAAMAYFEEHRAPAIRADQVERDAMVARRYGGTYSRGPVHMARVNIAEAILSMDNAGPPPDPDGHMNKRKDATQLIAEALDMMLEHWVQGTQPSDQQGREATAALMSYNAAALRQKGSDHAG
jgi:hypothetical protein